MARNIFTHVARETPAPHKNPNKNNKEQNKIKQKTRTRLKNILKEIRQLKRLGDDSFIKFVVQSTIILTLFSFICSIPEQ